MASPSTSSPISTAHSHDSLLHDSDTLNEPSTSPYLNVIVPPQPDLSPPSPMDFDGPIMHPLPPLFRPEETIDPATIPIPDTPEPPPLPEEEVIPCIPMQAFLSVYELLLHLFTVSDTHTAATAARSSKILHQPALDALWRYVPRASYLFSILGNLEGVASYDGHSSRRYDYDRDIHPQDWIRFLPYSRRVEELVCSDDSNSTDRWSEPSHKALAKVSASRPPDLTQKDVFPRLKSLTWSVYSHKVLRNLPMMIVPSLTSLEIKIDNVVEIKPMVAFLKQLQARCGPSLKNFRLNTDFSVSSVEEEVLEVFVGMTRLERLILPRFWITERIFRALAVLPNLQYIGQRKSFWWGNATDTEPGLLTAIESMEVGSFPALKDITYDTISLLESRHLFSHKHGPTRLTALCVTSSKLEAPRQLQDFLACLATSCPQLDDVDVGLTFQIPTDHKDDTDITTATLSPLHDLPNLIHFGLATHFPVALTDADLDEWTSKLPRMKVLWLNETPAEVVQQRDVRSRLTLNALRIIAKNCPLMEELSLFVDAGSVPSEEPMAPGGSSSGIADLHALAMGLTLGEASARPATFNHLRYLNLGVSHLVAPSRVANWLVDCMGKDKTTFCFDCSPRFWPAPMPSGELEGMIGRRREQWEDVSKMIPALMEAKLRMEGMRKEMMGLITGLLLRSGGTGAADAAGREIAVSSGAAGSS